MKRKETRVKVSRLFIFIFFFAFLGAIVKLLYVAISSDVDGKDLRVFADNRNTVKKTLYAGRGNIYDIKGEVLAQNVNSYTLIAYINPKRTTDANYPKHVVDKEATAKALEEVLGIDYEFALNQLNLNGYQVQFGIKGNSITENKKKELEALNLPGLDFIAGNQRYYKRSRAGAYIIGYAKTYEDGEIIGEMGIESYYNEILKGTDGYTEYQRDAYGYQMGDAIVKEPVSGNDIYLTLDSQIQLILEEATRTLEDENEFAWYTFSVMDAKTGAIVGSTSSPNYNPNTLEGLTNYVNPLVGYTYEPGSTMKIFSWLAAMEAGKYNGEDTFMSGSKKVADATIYDFNTRGWGTINYDTGFVYSSNVAASNLALELGSTKLREFYESLGFGAKTGIELPGEEAGVIRLTYETELASASFGQGITTTPIQNLQALSILTNDGVMLKPYIVDKIVDASGNITYQGGRKELGQKVSSDSIKKMNKLMYNVVYHGLTGKSWQPENVLMSGKTGTAQIASPNGGYLTGNRNYVRSFAGIFPYDNPKYIIYASVKQIDNSNSLAKVVTKAVESIANYANITNVASELDQTKVIKLNNYISSDVNLTSEALKSQSLEPIVLGNGSYVINQYPLNNGEVLKGSKVFLLTENNDYVMPDIKGWSTSDVLSFCNMIGLKCTFSNYGVVSEFSIPPGDKIDLTKTLDVVLSSA